MQVEEKQVTLRKLVASEGKVIISKELNEDGKPVLVSKEVYLGHGTNEDEFEEIDEELYEKLYNQESEEDNYER